MRDYPRAAVERMMKIQEIILRAIGKQITWLAAAQIIGISARQMRRMKARYEEYGNDGLYDRRRGGPSPKRVPLKMVEKILELYKEKYYDLNVKHFHEKLKEEQGIDLSYTWVKTALQGAGLVKKGRKRGVHRKRRERKALSGMMLHIDGSQHQWFQDKRWNDLIVIMDDATSEVYYAQLVDEESTRTVMIGIREVIDKHGIFCSLYSDRASHFFVTPKAGERVDRDRLTQVGRALRELGIEPIAAYSPQARGRSERGFRTWQGRLPQELRIREVKTVEEANRFLREEYIQEWNKRFAIPAAQKGSAFSHCRRRDLDQVFSIHHDRVVARDNTVSYANRTLQLEKTKWRGTLAGCKVIVHEHLDGSLSVTYGVHQVGKYSSGGVLISQTYTTKKSPVSRARSAA